MLPYVVIVVLEVACESFKELYIGENNVRFLNIPGEVKWFGNFMHLEKHVNEIDITSIYEFVPR